MGGIGLPHERLVLHTLFSANSRVYIYIYLDIDGYPVSGVSKRQHDLFELTQWWW